MSVTVETKEGRVLSEKRRKKKCNLQNRLGIPSKILLYGILLLFGLMCFLPFLMMISSSITSDDYIYQYGFPLLPKDIDFEAYHFLSFYASNILTGYKITVFTTVVGTVVSLLMCILTAYPLSNMEFRFRGAVSFYVFFTMMFGGGMVPYYILVKRYLHLDNTVWVMILPLLLNPGNVFLLRIFMQNNPKEIYESARLDGAGEYSILFRIVCPCVKSGIATVALFIVLQYWNEIVTPQLFIDKAELSPLANILNNLANSVGRPVTGSTTGMGGAMELTNSMLFAMCIVAAGPMVFVFQFFQKYFVEGLVMGSVKG